MGQTRSFGPSSRRVRLAAVSSLHLFIWASPQIAEVPTTDSLANLSQALRHAHHRRGLPGAIEDRRVLFLRPVHAKHRDEIALRCRQPVRFLVLARRLV